MRNTKISKKISLALVAAAIAPMIQVQALAAEPQQYRYSDGVYSQLDQIDEIQEYEKSAKQIGTDELQKQVLKSINEALASGSLSADEASDWKIKLNKINSQESWYKSLSKPIPASILAQNTRGLQEIKSQLAAKPTQNAEQSNSMPTGINEAISEALAKNRISSDTAAQYFLRLAQDESSLESLSRNHGTSGQIAQIQKDLAELKLLAQAQAKTQTKPCH